MNLKLIGYKNGEFIYRQQINKNMEHLKQKYEGSSKLTHHAFLEHREYSESKFIMDFFKSIPIRPYIVFI